jgi:hypothetical protein
MKEEVVKEMIELLRSGGKFAREGAKKLAELIKSGGTFAKEQIMSLASQILKYGLACSIRDIVLFLVFLIVTISYRNRIKKSDSWEQLMLWLFFGLTVFYGIRAFFAVNNIIEILTAPSLYVIDFVREYISRWNQ